MIHARAGVRLLADWRPTKSVTSPKLSLLVSALPSPIRIRLEHRPHLASTLDNIGWLFFDQILRIGVGLIVGVWMARYLGPGPFGQLNFGIAFVGIFGAVAGLGLEGIAVRDIINAPKHADATLGTAFALRLIGSVGAVLFGVCTINWLRPGDTSIRIIVAILSFSLVFKSTDFVKYWFEARVESRYTVWIENGVFLVGAGTKVIMIMSAAPLLSFVWLSLAEAGLIAGGLVLVYAIHGRSLRRLRFEFQRARTLLASSWPLVLSSVAIMIYMRIDQVMLGQMLDNEVVGVYSAAARLSEAWYFVPTAIVASVFPAILKAKATNEALYIRRMQILYDALVCSSFIAALLLSLTASWIVDIIYGPRFSSSASIFAIQVWAGVFVAMGIARGKWLLAENLQHVGYWFIGIAMLVNIAGNYIMIPSFGAKGAAVATVAAQVSATIVAPALFAQTRPSALMLIRSLNIISTLRRAAKWRT